MKLINACSFVILMSYCLEKSDSFKWPYSKENLSNDLVLWNTANQGVAGIDRAFSHISYDKILLLWHLEGEFKITFSQCHLLYIRLIQLVAVQIYGAIGIDLDPVAGKTDHTLYQKLVSPCKVRATK